jgi:hypothetical protein
MISAKAFEQYAPIIIMLIIAIIGYFIYMQWQRGKILKQCDGMHWCFFFKRGGGFEDMLLPEHRGEIRTVKDGIHEKAKKTGTYVESPVGNIGKYYTFPQSSFNAKYPPGKPKSIQQTIKLTAWVENFPLPIAFMNPEEWMDKDFLARLTSHLIDVSSDEAVARATQEMQKEVYADLHTVASKLKWGEYTFYAACGAVVGSLVSAGLTYTNDANIVKLIQALALALGHPIK